MRKKETIDKLSFDNWSIFQTYFVNINVYEFVDSDDKNAFYYRSGLMFSINEGKDINSLLIKDGKFFTMLTDIFSDNSRDCAIETAILIKDVFNCLVSKAVVFSTSGKIKEEINLEEVFDDEYNEELILEAIEEAKNKTIH